MIMQLVINGIAIGSVYSLVAVGLVLIFGLLEVVSFAHGAFVMLAMYASYWGFKLLGIDPYASLVMIVPGFFFIGVVIDRLIIRRISAKPAHIQIFVTNGLALVLVSLALMMWGPDYCDVFVPYSLVSLELFGIRIGMTSLIAIIANLLAVGALFAFLRLTYIGTAIRAVSQQRIGAQIVGIDVGLLYTVTFGIGAAFAALAGVTMSTMFSIYPEAANSIILVAFVTVVLGGYDSIFGAVVGGLVVGIIEVFAAYYVSAHLKEVSYFIVFVMILLFKPTGLFGRASAS